MSSPFASATSTTGKLHEVDEWRARMRQQWELKELSARRPEFKEINAGGVPCARVIPPLGWLM
jgi:hypothetical protein